MMSVLERPIALWRFPRVVLLFCLFAVDLAYAWPSETLISHGNSLPGSCRNQKREVDHVSLGEG